MKKALAIIAGIIVLLVLIALAIPLFIIGEQFRPTVESRLTAALGRKVAVGHLDLSIFHGSLKADDISIADDPAFSSQPFVKAKSLDVGVDLVPLILSHAVHIRAIGFVEPQVVLLRSNSGKWNFSSLGQGAESGGKKPPTQQTPATQPQGQAGGSAPDVTVQQLKIENGTVVIGTSPRWKQTYDKVNVSAQNVAYDSSFPFSVDAHTPGGGSMHIDGKAGPVAQEDASQTPLDAKVSLKQVNLATTGFIDPSSGINGIVDYDGTVHSDGKTAHTDGTAKVDKLRVVKTGTAANQPVTIHYATDYDLKAQTGRLTKGQITTGKSNVAVAGTFDSHGESPVLHMKLDAPNIPVQDIEALLPAVGVTLPSGASLQTGTLNTHLSLDGAVEQLVTTGDLNLSNAKLAGFGLGSKLAALSMFTGVKSSPDTIIQTMASNIRMDPAGIRTDNLKVIVADLGSISGAGAVGANGSLNYKLVAEIAQSGVGNVLSTFASRAGVGGAVSKGIPFSVEGTTSNPQFKPDTSAMLKTGLRDSASNPAGKGEALTPGNILSGILNKKKQQ